METKRLYDRPSTVGYRNGHWRSCSAEVCDHTHFEILNLRELDRLLFKLNSVSTLSHCFCYKPLTSWNVSLAVSSSKHLSGWHWAAKCKYALRTTRRKNVSDSDDFDELKMRLTLRRRCILSNIQKSVVVDFICGHGDKHLSRCKA